MSEDAQAPFRGSVEREVLVIEQDGYWLVHVLSYYPYMHRKSTRYIDRALAYDAAMAELLAAKEYIGEYAV